MRPGSIALFALMMLAACSGPEHATTERVRDQPNEPDAAAPGIVGSPNISSPDTALEPRAPWKSSIGPWVAHPAHPFRQRVAEGVYLSVASFYQGSHVVAAGPAGLDLIDLRTPGAPEVLAQVALGAETKDIALSSDGELAVVAADALHLIDLSDPLEPVVRGRLSVDNLTSVALSSDGTRVLAASSRVVYTVDIRDLDTPVVTGSVELGNILGLALAPNDATAFAYGYTGVSVLDVRSATPSVTSRLSEEQGAVSRALTSRDSETLFVAVAHQYLAFDVRDPSAPLLLGRLRQSRGFSPKDLDLSEDGKSLFALRSDAVEVIDVRQPTAMTSTATFEIEQGTGLAPLAASRSLMVASGTGLTLVALDNPAMTALRDAPTGALEHCRDASDVRLSADGGQAFIAAESLLVVDITDPAALALVGRHDTELTNLAVSADGQTVYGTQTWRGGRDSLWAFDVRGVEPAEVSVYEGPTAQPMDIALTRDGRWLFLVTEGGGGLDVMDMGDLNAPTRVAHFYVRHTEAIELSPDETLVYIADPYENGLLALDVTAPAEPSVRSVLPLAVTTLAMCPDGQTLLAGGRDGDLHIIDTSDASAMAVIGSLSMASPTDLAVSADCNTAYVTDGYALRVVDIARPDAPAIAGMFEVPGAPTGIALSPDGLTAVVVSDDAASCVGLVDIVPPTLDLLEDRTPGVLQFRLRLTNHFAPRWERIAWHASAGEVAVSDLDLRHNTATVTWTRAEPGPEDVLEVAVGNHQYFQVARVVGDL